MHRKHQDRIRSMQQEASRYKSIDWCRPMIDQMMNYLTNIAISLILPFTFFTLPSRPLRYLTMAIKSNAQCPGMVLWDEILSILAESYPEDLTESMLVDAMTVRIVLNRTLLDTIVFVCDLAAVKSRSISLASFNDLN